MHINRLLVDTFQLVLLVYRQPARSNGHKQGVSKILPFPGWLSEA